MKKILPVTLILCIVVAIALFFQKKEVVAPAPRPDVSDTQVSTTPVALCFGMFTPANQRGFSDAYTLHMLLDNEKGTASGELKFMPGEKDSKVGSFTGNVSAVDKSMMARTINAIWNTAAEGMNAKEELKIIFGEGTASIGTGEMVERDDGIYAYKDPSKLNYSLNLSDVACSDLTLRENVEAYLRAHISTLSPVAPVLGGTWYVVGISTDLQKHSGIVVYEDGHIQEKKNFTFTAGADASISKLTIQ